MPSARRRVVALPGTSGLADTIAKSAQLPLYVAEQRRFPDGETYLRIDDDVENAHVLLVASLARPDTTLLPALLAGATLRELGAARVLLVAPYLPYLRQDRCFRRGEARSAHHVAALLSSHFDGVATVEPHLHRLGSLDQVFEVPTLAISAADEIAKWIDRHHQDPLLVAPDEEARQWVDAVSEALGGVPTLVLRKERRGDRDVQVSCPAVVPPGTPILVDDIISSGMTIVEAARTLRGAGAPIPHCIAVHALFGEGAMAAVDAETATLVTTNTVTHKTNAIDVAPGIAAAIHRSLQ